MGDLQGDFMIFSKPELTKRRQELRNSATETEQLLWEQLRSEKLGVKFRRQHSIGNYIADFYCPSKKLVIEIDGSQHYTDEGLGYDKVRDEFIESLGIKIIRFSNREILEDMAVVLEKIKGENFNE